MGFGYQWMKHFIFSCNIHTYIHPLSAVCSTQAHKFSMSPTMRWSQWRAHFWVNVRWGPGGRNRMADKVPLVSELLPLKPTKPLDYCPGLRQIAKLFSIHYSATSNYQELNVYHWWLSIVRESYLVKWI
jgi:hypothetical protein